MALFPFMYIETMRLVLRAIRRPIRLSPSIVLAALFFTRTSLVGRVLSIENGTRCQLDKHNYLARPFLLPLREEMNTVCVMLQSSKISAVQCQHQHQYVNFRAGVLCLILFEKDGASTSRNISEVCAKADALNSGPVLLNPDCMPVMTCIEHMHSILTVVCKAASASHR